MSKVTFTPLVDGKPPERPPKKPIDWPILAGKIGMWLTVISFGGVFWAVNGGFSVIGLGVIASSFNEAGRLAWAALTAVRFAVPVQVAGLPLTQPLIPWLGVIAATLLQISVAWLKLSGRLIPPSLLIFAALLSLYDYGTTFFGLGTVVWIAAIGPVAQALIALPLTFGLEATIGYALRR
jgi:hypothetical protein